MNRSCDDVREILGLHVEGTLDPAEAEGVAQHLGSCAACREEERRERAAWRALDAVPGAAPPSGFAERVAEAARGSSRWRRLVPLAAAASIAIALLAGTFALRRTGGALSDEEVIAHLDLLESWDLVSDPELAVALDAPEEDLLPLGGVDGR